MSVRLHLIVNNYSLQKGGAERLARQLHLGLLSRGRDSFLLGLTTHDDHQVERARSLQSGSRYSWAALAGLRRHFRDEVRDGDIVHAHLSPSIVYTGLMRALGERQFHLLMTEHNTHNRRRGTMSGLIIDQFVYGAMEKIVCISEGTQEALHEWMPSTRAKTVVIDNGVALRFPSPIRRAPGRKLRLLSLGRLTRQKNYANTLHALASVGELEFEYRIGGSGEDEQELKGLSEALGLGSAVNFLGFIDDIEPLLQWADVFLLPSRWEGFGLGAVEAMNACLPVVAGNVPGLRELVGGELPCGLLVDPGSPESIANAISTLARSPQQREELGRQGFSRSLRFSETRMLDRHLGLYDELSSDG